jgi:hypothetical protein
VGQVPQSAMHSWWVVVWDNATTRRRQEGPGAVEFVYCTFLRLGGREKPSYGAWHGHTERWTSRTKAAMNERGAIVLA